MSLQFLTLDSRYVMYSPIECNHQFLTSDSSCTVQLFNTPFKLRDLGPTTELLGIQINQNRSQHSLTISQPQYCTEMLAQYGMGDSKPGIVPLAQSIMTCKSDVGSLQFLTSDSRYVMTTLYHAIYSSLHRTLAATSQLSNNFLSWTIVCGTLTVYPSQKH